MIEFKVNESLFQVSEVDVSYRAAIPKEDRLQISKSSEVYEMLHSVYDPDLVDLKEFFFIVLLNRANEVLGVKKVSEGGTAGTVVDIKIIFQIAIKTNCSAIILTHNHPSGNLKPSEADKNITKKLCEVGRILEIPVHDHIIYTPNGFYSMADNGHMS